MTKLDRIAKEAQATANRTGKAMAVFNLNTVGQALYVIREADSFPSENRLVAGPFSPTYQPEPNTSVSHGTMRTEDLLASLSAELRRFDGAETTYAHVLGEAEVYSALLTSNLADDPVTNELASHVVAELMDTLGELAPEGCYFGAHEGDGSDYGYWEASYNIEDCDND